MINKFIIKKKLQIKNLLIKYFKKIVILFKIKKINKLNKLNNLNNKFKKNFRVNKELIFKLSKELK